MKYNIGDYIVYKRDVCRIKQLKNDSNGREYYVLSPIDDGSLIINVPVSNDFGYIRRLIGKDEINNIINNISSIEPLDYGDKRLEGMYKELINSGTHEDLIKVIKTAYLRNKERIDNNKKISDKDNMYFNKAEKYLYSEFSIVLGISFDDVKNYIIEKVSFNNEE